MYDAVKHCHRIVLSTAPNSHDMPFTDRCNLT